MQLETILKTFRTTLLQHSSELKNDKSALFQPISSNTRPCSVLFRPYSLHKKVSLSLIKLLLSKIGLLLAETFNSSALMQLASELKNETSERKQTISALF